MQRLENQTNLMLLTSRSKHFRGSDGTTKPPDFLLFFLVPPPGVETQSSRMAFFIVRESERVDLREEQMHFICHASLLGRGANIIASIQQLVHWHKCTQLAPFDDILCNVLKTEKKRGENSFCNTLLHIHTIQLGKRA